jgi:hypothetical protein
MSFSLWSIKKENAVNWTVQFSELSDNENMIHGSLDLKTTMIILLKLIRHDAGHCNHVTVYIPASGQGHTQGGLEGERRMSVVGRRRWLVRLYQCFSTGVSRPYSDAFPNINQQFTKCRNNSDIMSSPVHCSLLHFCSLESPRISLNCNSYILPSIRIESFILLRLLTLLPLFFLKILYFLWSWKHNRKRLNKLRRTRINMYFVHIHTYLRI